MIFLRYNKNVDLFNVKAVKVNMNGMLAIFYFGSFKSFSGGPGPFFFS